MSEVRNICCYFDDNGTFEDIDFQDIINLVGENNLLTTLKDVESKLIEAMEMIKDTNLTYETAKKIIREFGYLGTSSNGGINWITNFNFPSRSSNHTPATYTIKGDQTFYINSNISNDRWTGRGVDEFRNAMETFVESLKEQNAYIQSSHKQSLKSSTVYSDSFDEMIQKDFTYKGNRYTWNDIDCVYYNDNGDEEDFFMEIPEGAITSAKKPIKSGINDILIGKSDNGEYSIYLSDCKHANHGKDPHQEYMLAHNGQVTDTVRTDDPYATSVKEHWQDVFHIKDVQSSRKPIKSAHDRETLKKVIRAYLDKMGYKDVEGGVDAAADYILQNEEYYSDYDLHSKVKQWFKETKENYPETLIKASKTIKSGYYDTTEHPEGGGTCDNCHGEVMPGDGYESDFESSREMALEGIVDAFKLGNVNIQDYSARQQLVEFLDMEDEDELEDAISTICNMAFEGKGYMCPDCAKEQLAKAAKAWAEDNYDLDNEIESSAIKSAKSEFGYDAHEIMTFDEFKNFVKSNVEPVEMFDYKSAYFVILNTEEDCKKLQQRLDNTYGVGCTYYSLQDPNNEYYGKWQLMG